jgi:hypothetical protein
MQEAYPAKSAQKPHNFAVFAGNPPQGCGKFRTSLASALAAAAMASTLH